MPRRGSSTVWCRLDEISLRIDGARFTNPGIPDIVKAFTKMTNERQHHEVPTMSIAATVSKYRSERRRRGATPAHPSLVDTGLLAGYGFQRALEAGLSTRHYG